MKLITKMIDNNFFTKTYMGILGMFLLVFILGYIATGISIFITYLAAIPFSYLLINDLKIKTKPIYKYLFITLSELSYLVAIGVSLKTTFSYSLLLGAIIGTILFLMCIHWILVKISIVAFLGSIVITMLSTLPFIIFSNENPVVFFMVIVPIWQMLITCMFNYLYYKNHISRAKRM